MSQAPSILIMILGFVLLLGPLVVIHELGHYWVGRWCGVKADAFSVGFGRELFGWTDRRGTRWKLSAIPLGGYVQFAGDMDPTSRPDDAKFAHLSPAEQAATFNAKALWQRTLIVAAGPLTNLLFALLIFSAFNLAFGKIVSPPVVGHFAEQAPAREAGLRVGDRIVAIDGTRVEQFPDIVALVVPYPGRTISVALERGGQPLVIPVRLLTHVERDKFGNESRIGRLGISPAQARIEPVGPGEAVALAGRQTWSIMRMLVVGVQQIVTGERSVKELGGPIKTAKYSGEQLSLGWLSFVSFAAFISINLAFINLLPIPALDGGHLAFYAAEAIRRKPLDARSQNWAFRTGLAFVLALMLFVTFNDLVSLLPAGRG
ncbi:RIP metalloprotease RseP [Novosphingobium piscinae]|uniref:Zinc metalloprotease n=2 Tax=Novosphingobium piscinae TaxID=1507448 RepID=A0A7X1FX16_9SPHN|nr:RIP metalloprotease RseP [Novosphingobium piscinae]